MDKKSIYKTKEIADLIGVHVNTVRFYEKIGFLTAPVRKANGYRQYSNLQLMQCRLIRCAMRAEVLQNGLRDKAVEIVRLCADCRFDDSLAAVITYRSMIENEITKAREAVVIVDNCMKQIKSAKGETWNRKEAAAFIQVTPETLRTWERSGLLTVKRRRNGYRVYDISDMQRLRIIRTLRLANYSISSILRLLGKMAASSVYSAEEILNTPDEGEDIISACDQLIVSLQNTERDIELMQRMINAIKSEYEER